MQMPEISTHEVLPNTAYSVAVLNLITIAHLRALTPKIRADLLSNAETILQEQPDAALLVFGHQDSQSPEMQRAVSVIQQILTDLFGQA